jgi:hypothetical protein
MFFRRVQPKVPTFAERLELLRNAGFAIDRLPDDRIKVTKHGVAAILGDETRGQIGIQRAGILIGAETAVLLNGGYQMFLETPSGKRYPAQAEQLRALHQFEEDVKAALGLTNLYNTSLGTTSRKHDYDRVFQREAGKQPKPWEKKDHRIVAPDTKETRAGKI